MLDVNTAYNMDVDHLIQVLHCENLGPKAQMLLETIEELKDERSEREDELEVEVEQLKEEHKQWADLIAAVSPEDVDDSVEILTMLPEYGIDLPSELKGYLELLRTHDIDSVDQLEKILVAVKVLQDLKDDD